MGPFELALLIPELEVPAKRRFGSVQFESQVGQGDKAPTLDQFEHFLPSFFDEHG